MQTIEKTIKSTYPPQRQDVLWLDVSNPSLPLLKGFNNGKWEQLSNEGAQIEQLVNTLFVNPTAEEKEIKPSILPIEQEMGDSEDAVLSQKVVSEAIDNFTLQSANYDYDEDLEDGCISGDATILDPGEDLYAYGVLIDWTNCKSSYDLQRIGNPELHRTLPVQSQYKGVIWDYKNSSIITYLNPDDWTAATDDYTAQEINDMMTNQVYGIRVETPKFYATSKILEVDGSGCTVKAKVMFSTKKINDRYIEIPKMVTDFRNCRCANDAGDDRLTGLVCNIYDYDVEVKGGYCTTKNNILTGKDGLLHPITNLDRATARGLAHSANTNLFSYSAYKWIFYWAFTIEYATLWSAKPMNNQLDINGYHQGGLGPGMTSIESYGATDEDGNYLYDEDYNINKTFYGNVNYFQGDDTDVFPLRDIGVTNTLGNNTGEITIEYSIDANTTSLVHQNRYRGFEFPFGDVVMNLDGFIGHYIDGVAELYYTCDNPNKFSDTIPSDYNDDSFRSGWKLSYFDNKFDEYHRDGYDEGFAKYVNIGDAGDIFAQKWNVNYDNWFGYFVNNIYPIDGNDLTTLSVGSRAADRDVQPVGLGLLRFDDAVDDAGRHWGFRCFNIIED